MQIIEIDSRRSDEQIVEATRQFRPSNGSYISIDTWNSEEVSSSAKIGLNIIRSVFSRNEIFVAKDFYVEGSNLNVQFLGNNNTLILGERCKLSGNIIFDGDNSIVLISGPQSTLNVSINIYEKGVLFWGRRSSAYGVRAWIHGGKSCIVGNNCLMSDGVQIRTSDHHAIIDMRSKKVISCPKGVRIGDHVWIGEGVSILKGAKIGDGAIIGTRSLVVGRIGSAELWAGVPARRLRRSTTWADTWAPTSNQIDAAIRDANLTNFRAPTLLERAALRLRRRESRDPS